MNIIAQLVSTLLGTALLVQSDSGSTDPYQLGIAL